MKVGSLFSGIGDWTSALNAPEWKSGGKLKTIPSVSECSQSTGPTCPVTETSEMSEAQTLSPLTSSVVASRVSLLPTPEEDEVRQMTAGSGRRCFDSFERLSRPTSWVKTYLASLLTRKDYYSPLSSLTWRLRGTKSRRLLYFRLVPSVPYIEGIGSGFVPTLDTTTGAPNKGSNKKNGPTSLLEALRLMPTLQAGDWKNRGGFGSDAVKRRKAIGKQIQLSMVVGGNLNPTWAEWYMGFPAGWSELNPSETPSSPKQPS